tara:strand:- start:2308 stop:3318 length:1011 start_codon:yes stop_codon:yes gene_type:complete
LNFEKYSTVIWKLLSELILTQTADVYDIVKYSLGVLDQKGNIQTKPSGKILRSILCTFTCDSTGGNWENALQSAISLELIHNFSLIHDDIQDEDTQRRHQPTAWTIWGKEKALVGGTTTHCLANITSLMEFSDSCSNKAIQLHLSKVLSEKCLQMIQGQVLDLSFEHKTNVTIEEYLEMISGKTAALISCAMHMGAYISEQNDSKALLFNNIGYLLGLAYQIRDDILGIWGNSEFTGKGVGSDVFRKKKSLPIIHGSQIPEHKTSITEIYSKNTVDKADLASVMEIMDTCKTQAYCQNLANAYCDKAIKNIDDAPIDQHAKKEMVALAHYFVERNT